MLMMGTQTESQTLTPPFHESPAAATSYHAQLRDSVDGSWDALHFVGVQRNTVDGERFEEFDLELRNCPCGSTICRRVPAGWRP